MQLLDPALHRIEDLEIVAIPISVDDWFSRLFESENAARLVGRMNERGLSRCRGR
jgi:hypothetical protein